MVIQYYRVFTFKVKKLNRTLLNTKGNKHVYSILKLSSINNSKLLEETKKNFILYI
jgi:hypothetical protein